MKTSSTHIRSTILGTRKQKAAAIREALGKRSIVMVGMMGCGKSAIGRRLAHALELAFVDADEEIEKAAGKSIAEIFTEHGEPHFREGERKVIARLLGGGPQVLATGGGAFMDETTRGNVSAAGISIWLNADIEVLIRRVARRDNRPLLKAADPNKKMRELLEHRRPFYAMADVSVQSRDVSHELIVDEIISLLLDNGVMDRCRGTVGGEQASGGQVSEAKAAGGRADKV